MGKYRVTFRFRDNEVDIRGTLWYNKTMRKEFNNTKVTQKYAHVTEYNALRAGESAFKARIPFNSNPYHVNPVKSAWIRGFKRAERTFNEMLQRSRMFQESLPLEED